VANTWLLRLCREQAVGSRKRIGNICIQSAAVKWYWKLLCDCTHLVYTGSGMFVLYSVQRFPCEFGSHLDRSGNSLVLMNPNVHHHVHRNPALDPILSQFNPLHIPTI